MSSDTWPEEKKLIEKCVRSGTVTGSNITQFISSLSASSRCGRNACAVKLPRLATRTSLGEEITRSTFSWRTLIFDTPLFRTDPSHQMLIEKQKIRTQHYNCSDASWELRSRAYTASNIIKWFLFTQVIPKSQPFFKHKYEPAACHS